MAPRPGSNLQIDFMYLRGPYKLKGLGQVLNIVDIHSRRAWSIPPFLASSSTDNIAGCFAIVHANITRLLTLLAELIVR